MDGQTLLAGQHGEVGGQAAGAGSSAGRPAVKGPELRTSGNCGAAGQRGEVGGQAAGAEPSARRPGFEGPKMRASGNCGAAAEDAVAGVRSMRVEDAERSLARQTAVMRGTRSALLLALHLHNEAERMCMSALVDSGSGQPPLISESCAKRLGIVRGAVAGSAGQADGKPIPLYHAGRVEMALIGRSCMEQCFIAPIQTDLILGEEWLYRRHGVLDYASDDPTFPAITLGCVEA